MITVTSINLANEKVCVFVRAYNASKYINECLDSLIGQDFSSEIYIKILYDKGSSDNTLDYLEKYIKYNNTQSNRYIEIIQHEHCSPFRSLLIGMKMFCDRYDYFSILDYDNLYDNQYVSKAIETLKMSKSDFLYSNPVTIMGDLNNIGEKLLKNRSINIKSKKLLKYLIFKGNFIDGNTIFMTKDGCNTIKSKLVELSSPTSDWIFEDYAIGAVALYHLNVTTLKGNYIYYRIHESNITCGNNNFKKYKLNMDRNILTYSSFGILLRDRLNLVQKLIYLFFFSLNVFISSTKFIFKKRIK
jgi:glycosyltransferase involved in cell wall biosynthesis